MFFEPQVKERREDFFNFEVLQQELKSAIEDKTIPLIAIHGPRRTGKTSLMRVVLNTIKKDYIWIDGRDISSREDFYSRLSEEAQKTRRFKIEKISIKGVELKLNLFKKGLDYLNKHKMILVIDEAQLLKKYRLDQAVASIYDNQPHIKIILSGSQTGMLMNFLGKGNASASLYGRAVFELQTQRLTKEDAYRFLRNGANQTKLDFEDNDIMTAINELGGIIGWLTKYGWYRLKLPHKDALRKTVDEGKLTAMEEFLKFAARSENRYKKIIKVIKGGARWEEIKKQTAISDKQLYMMLKHLVDQGFIEKQEGLYSIIDPLLEAAV